MTTDIAALRKAALKATPGDWKIGLGSAYAYVQASIDMKLGGRSWVKLCHLGNAGWRKQQSTIDDARFIAMANPATIIAILDQLEAAHQRADEGAKEITYWCNLTARNNEQIEKLEAELAALKAESEIIPAITCYSCRKEMTRDQHAEADGFCPHCDVEIELDEEDKIITAPQKPTISKQKLCDWLEDNFGIADSQRDAFAACFDHCCGCIVKSEQ